MKLKRIENNIEVATSACSKILSFYNYLKNLSCKDYAFPWINCVRLKHGFSRFPDGILRLQDYRFFTFFRLICNQDLDVIQ